MTLSEYHSKFPGSVRWRVTGRGIDVEDVGPLDCDIQMYNRAKALCTKHAQAFAASSVTYQVPVELLMACALTESAAKDPETCVREEPGFISDEKTPARISAGLCQLLISTARSIMKDPRIDRAWLLNPINSIRACTAYIKSNKDHQGTDWDPIYAACAYNAGGLYENKGESNRWKLRQYPIGTSNHADRLAGYFAAARQLVDGGLFKEGTAVTF